MKGLNVFIFGWILTLLITSCAAKKNKYIETNKVHLQHIEEVVETIQKPLPPPQPSPEVFVADIKGKRDDLD